jgi:hypothetical protein
MKINIKLISLITILGSLFYFLGHKNKTFKSIAPIIQPKEQVIIVDKKTNSANLLAPKAYISVQPTQNGLGVGSNWKSK